TSSLGFAAGSLENFRGRTSIVENRNFGVQNGDTGNFDQIIFIGETFDDDQSASRRVFLVHPTANFVVTFAILSVRDIGRRHHQTIKRTARGFQNRFDIVEYLTCLSFDISLADHIAVLVRGGLTGDEKQFAAFREDGLGISWPWIVQRLRLTDLCCHYISLFVPVLRREL